MKTESGGCLFTQILFSEMKNKQSTNSCFECQQALIMTLSMSYLSLQTNICDILHIPQHRERAFVSVTSLKPEERQECVTFTCDSLHCYSLCKLLLRTKNVKRSCYVTYEGLIMWNVKIITFFVSEYEYETDGMNQFAISKQQPSSQLMMDKIKSCSTSTFLIA